MKHQSAQKDEVANPIARAEDILLGGLGFGSEAKIIEVRLKADHFSGTGCWQDGEEFTFESEEKATDLELWAIETLTKHNQSK